MSLSLYVTSTTLVLLFTCTGTVGTLVPATLCLCHYVLLVPHWHCCLHVLVLLVHLCQPLCLCASMLLVPHWYCCLLELVLLLHYSKFIVAFQLQFGIYKAESERFRWEKEKPSLKKWFSRQVDLLYFGYLSDVPFLKPVFKEILTIYMFLSQPPMSNNMVLTEIAWFE